MIPLMQPLPFVVEATKVLVGIMTQPTLVTFQMLLSGVLLYSTQNLSQLGRLWLQKKSIACFSYFFNDAKWQREAFARAHLEMLNMHYGKRMKRPGRFIIDDTLFRLYSPTIRSNHLQCARSDVVPEMSWFIFKNYCLM